MRAPSWRAAAVAILENDHNLYSLGFQLRETALSDDLWRARKREEKRKMDAMDLFEKDKAQSQTHSDAHEAIDVIEAWRLSYCLGRAVECIAERRGTSVDDLERAAQFLAREIETLRRTPRAARRTPK